MLNPFPIQFLALFAHFILRLFVAGILIYLGVSHFKNRKNLKEILRFSWVPFGTFPTYNLIFWEILAGLFVLVGAYTQYAVLIVMIMSLKLIAFGHRFRHHSIPPKIFYVLLFAAALSLFITGAGVVAFDLPI